LDTIEERNKSEIRETIHQIWRTLQGITRDIIRENNIVSNEGHVISKFILNNLIMKGMQSNWEKNRKSIKFYYLIFYLYIYLTLLLLYLRL
jgi:hypothetical protein